MIIGMKSHTISFHNFHVITCHCCRPRRWGPECSGSNVSTGVGFCPDHPRPRQWNWCSCIQQSPHWTLKDQIERSLTTSFNYLLTDGRNGCNDLSQLQLVKDCGFTSCIQSNHENSHLFFAKEAFEEGGEHVTHVGGLGYLTRWDETLWKIRIQFKCQCGSTGQPKSRVVSAV